MSAGLPDSSVPRTAGAIIVAAGAGTRMEGVDKVFAPLRGEPLIAHTVRAFERCPAVETIVLVVAGPLLAEMSRLVDQQGWQKAQTVTVGGPRRQDSVVLGLRVLAPCEWVVVHDGARPLVHPDLIAKGLEVAADGGAAIAAVPVKDTVKVVGTEGQVQATLDRSTLWQAQTPQVFRRDLLERAHREVAEDVTDDAAMVEGLGMPVRVFLGSYENIKVTTPEDLLMAEALLANSALL